MRYLVKILTLSVYFVLIGCAHTEAERKSRVAIDTATPEQHGLVFGSIGAQKFDLDGPFKVKQIFRFVHVGIRPLGQPGATPAEDVNSRPWLSRTGMAFDGQKGITSEELSKGIAFEDDQMLGRAFVEALKPGRYEIYTAAATWGNYVMDATGQSAYRPYLSIPLEIKPGEAIYLGKFVAQITGIKQ